MPRRISMLDLARASRDADATGNALQISVNRWMLDCCHRAAGNSDYTCLLHLSYAEWAIGCQEQSVCSRQAFEGALVAAGYEIVEGCCVGVRLNS